MRIVTNLRNRLVNYLEPIDQDERMAVNFSTRRAMVTPWVTIAACIVIVVLALGVIAAVVWTSTSQVSMPAVQDAAIARSIPETTEAPAEMRGGPGQGTSPQVQTRPLIVSVVGLVVNPGVAEVPAGVRIVEAVDRAGGLLPEANPTSVNLAAPLVDGQQIVVGAEALPAGTAEGRADVSNGFGAGAADVADPGGSGGKININTASTTQLEGLPGIGPATTTKVIDLREKNGAFVSINALEEVPGISPAKVEALRDAATIRPARSCWAQCATSAGSGVSVDDCGGSDYAPRMVDSCGTERSHDYSGVTVGVAALVVAMGQRCGGIRPASDRHYPGVNCGGSQCYSIHADPHSASPSPRDRRITKC